MTQHEIELIAALEDDIDAWEQEIAFFETLVEQVTITGGNAMLGREYARGLRQRINQHKALIEKVKKG